MKQREMMAVLLVLAVLALVFILYNAGVFGHLVLQ
jgi:hypothetical protein